MAVVSEAVNGSLPITRIMDYIDKIGIDSKALALTYINDSYSQYSNLLNKKAKKENDKKNIRTRNRS